MPAILSWFASVLFSGFAKELFRRAAIMVTFNIVMGFLIQWLMTHGLPNGLGVFEGGGTVSQLFSTISPLLLYVFDAMWVVPGVFLVLNAHLWRLTGRMVVRSVTAG